MFHLVRVAELLGRFTSRYVPSAFSIALLLTAFTFGLALTLGGISLGAAVKGWGSGFWELLSFSMQMALVMFTGYLLALTPAVRWLLRKVASLPKSPRAAVAGMALTSMLLAYINWGLSLVASAMLVREVVRRRPDVDYRLLVACAYFGLGATWHAGLSASAPLLVATPGHFLEAKMGVLPIDTTLFSAFNLGLVGGALVLLTGLAWILHPPPGQAVTVDPALFDSRPDARAEPVPVSALDPEPPRGRRSFATWVDHSPWLNWLFAVGGGAWLIGTLSEGGWKALNINTLNFTFLTLAVWLHRTPARLLAASEEAGTVLAGVVLQFPLYAGIYGIFRTSGLTERLGELFVSMSTERTFPVVVYLYSGLVNYFVPSGGSKWAIEAPYLLEAASSLGVPSRKVVLAYAWGDMATDLIQPFWAIPLLAVARIEFKEVLGFLLVAFAVYLPLVALAFLLL